MPKKKPQLVTEVELLTEFLETLEVVGRWKMDEIKNSTISNNFKPNINLTSNKIKI